jgi:hypothetical protein
MPTDLQQVTAIRGQTLALIAELTANPKPTYTIADQSVAWGDYLKQLQETIGWCDQQIAALAPFEVRSQGFT